MTFDLRASMLDSKDSAGRGQTWTTGPVEVSSHMLVKGTMGGSAYDDGCTARELDEDEQRFLETVCNMLGHDLEAAEL